MFYIILLIAGVVLAANRKQQASAAVETPATVAQSDTVMLPHFTDIVKNFLNGPDLYHYPMPTGPGIGAPLSANNPGISNVIVSGPNIYKPGGPPATAAPAVAGGGGAAGGTTPSGTGGGGLPPSPPSGPHFPNTL